MIRLVTYASERMTRSMNLCLQSSLKYGVKDADGHEGKCFTGDFVEMNKATLEKTRGAGYWLWKPYIILAKMLGCQDGDILIYSDAGVEWVNDVRHLIDSMDEDIFLFSNGHKHVEWCKMDVLEAIIPGRHNMDLPQVQASVILFRVNQKTRDFVKEWLLYSQMPGFIDDSPSKLPNYPTFAEHRHDQAILTCLQIKHGYKQHWWADGTWIPQRHRWPHDHYPQMFHHHRKRNNEW
jgi:hypothetical protein